MLADLSDGPAPLDADLPGWLARACRAAAAPEVFRDGAAGLVAVSGHSHEHVCRTMRRHMDLSPSGFVNAMRMDHAARLLRSDTLSVAQIADAVGISNVGHFHRLFRERYGTTPRTYRDNARRVPL